ncbi:di-heme oxidoredictase family protein [Amaricoccus sp.]|uniref:di-heme oxidoreductase family protein n=1 Tax=Amaricoccus sp. TaxID=1872485 RepID=UPI001B699067|nr:di-heme oxidoredictase family protein [Amaricoccus sp.]MBP7241531.1 c-type cytochrome [Amaricoccus sp.]
MRRVLIAGALVLAAPLAASQPAEDAHLNVTPRTAEEAARVATVTAPAASFAAPEPFETNPGGAATNRRKPDANAFSFSSATLDFARELDFKVGNGIFRKLWVSAPSSTQASDGLGPIFNARACQNCHLKDARGHPPAPGEPATQMFLRLSVPSDHDALADEIADWIGAAPEPVYGGQFQTFSIAGVPAEGRMTIDYAEEEVALAGGETARLRRPAYGVADLAYGPMAEGVMFSPRVAPQMIGLGLVEAIPEADILANADPDDADGDGISGRPNIVWSDEFARPMLGRFGHKAGKPTIREQTAGAFSGDMGISTSLHPAGAGDCAPAQEVCRAAPDGGDPEVDDAALDLVTFYSRNLAVPARRDVDDPEVLRGKELFYATGCPACHAPKFVTHRMPGRPELSFQLIWPYSDFLLHDLGEGLADGRPEGRADGREWRTAPLWGIGLTATVTGRESYLHDGRARTLLEAVLWHGGEAQAARDGVVGMAPEDRAALVRFLGSL